jgi:membrane protein DedA with SNARE-associated domain
VILMALGSTLFPVPSEVVMPFAGYLASTGRFHLIWAVLAGTIGCNIGSTILYYIGAQGGRHFVSKYGRYVLLNDRKIEQMERYFHRWGGITLLVTHVLPFFPAVISLPAGFARMSMWQFQIYTFIGCFIWCFGLAVLGYEFGLAWKDQPWVKAAIHWLNIALVVLIVLTIGWLVREWRTTKNART